MVRIWKKEKESCGGKLIATDFKRLNPKIFYPVHELTKEDLNKELALFAPDGKIYVNTKIEGWNLVFSTLEILIGQEMETLKEFEKENHKKFPNIKTFDDWAKLAQSAKTDEERNDAMQVLGMLAVPIEIKRREIEKEYYG